MSTNISTKRIHSRMSLNFHETHFEVKFTTKHIPFIMHDPNERKRKKLCNVLFCKKNHIQMLNVPPKMRGSLNTQRHKFKSRTTTNENLKRDFKVVELFFFTFELRFFTCSTSTCIP